MSASPVDVIETAQVPVSLRGARANKNRLGIGLWLLMSLLALVALSTPWAFGEVTLSGNSSAPRWAAGNVQLSLMPPVWMADEVALQRAEQAHERLRQERDGQEMGRDRGDAGGGIALALAAIEAVAAIGGRSGGGGGSDGGGPPRPSRPRRARQERDITRER